MSGGAPGGAGGIGRRRRARRGPCTARRAAWLAALRAAAVESEVKSAGDSDQWQQLWTALLVVVVASKVMSSIV